MTEQRESRGGGYVTFEQLKDCIGKEATFQVPQAVLESHMGRFQDFKDEEAARERIKHFPRLKGTIALDETDNGALRIYRGIRTDNGEKTSWSPVLRADHDIIDWDIQMS